MNARTAIELNQLLIVDLIDSAKGMAERFKITINEAIDRKVSSYVKYSKSGTQAVAWELRGEEAKKLIK